MLNIYTSWSGDTEFSQGVQLVLFYLPTANDFFFLKKREMLFSSEGAVFTIGNKCSENTLDTTSLR